MAKTYRFDPEDEPQDTPRCPECHGHGVYLGNLGYRAHFRCRACGIDYSHVDHDAPKEGF